VVVGADFDDIGLTPKQGSAHVFVRVGASWMPQAMLTAPDGAAADMFGRSVGVVGDTVVVGAQWDEPDGSLPVDNNGSVYVFNRAGGVWSPPTNLRVAGTGSLGVSVAISDHTVLAGAAFTKVGENVAQGAAYVFEHGPRSPASASEVPRSSLVRLG
jgi:hypothetical protein